MVKRIIALTGPIGGGKSTLAREFSLVYPRVNVLAFSGVLRDMLSAFLPPEQASQLSYTEQKRWIYRGLTGREWMIRWANDMKQVDEYILIDILLERIRCMPESTTAVVDGLGTMAELDQLKSYTTAHCDSKLIVIHQDSYAESMHRTVNLTENRYATDCRYNLRAYADLVNPSIQEIINILD